jgi:hypothetical protein
MNDASMPQPPRNEKDLTKRIRDLAAQRGIPERDLRGLLGNVVVGQMLPDCVVKGGTAMYLRYGHRNARYSPDLDVSRPEPVTPEMFRTELAKLLQGGWGLFNGRVKVVKPAKKPVGVPDEYVMVPYEVVLNYRAKSWFSVPFELGHQELGGVHAAPQALDQDIVSIFNILGLPEPQPIAVLPSAHQVAQKLHACSNPGSDRAHDLIDIQVLASDGLDLRETADVCRRLFRSRRKHAWPPVVLAYDGWAEKYDEQRRNLDVKPTVAEAVIWVNTFITDLDHY